MQLIFLLSYLYNVKLPAEVDNTFEDYRLIINNEINDFESNLNELPRSLILLTQSPIIINYTQDYNNQDYKTKIQDLFFEYARGSREIAQVRYINQTGYETIRLNINYDGTENYNRVQFVEDNQLQYKGDRSYFIVTKEMQQSQVYISNMELNRENDIIQYINGNPVPVIRFSSPIILNQEFKGIIIINYYLNPYYNHIEDVLINLVNPKEIAIVNQEYEYLFNSNGITWTSSTDLGTGEKISNYYDIDGKDHEFNEQEHHSILFKLINLNFTDTSFQPKFVVVIDLRQIENLMLREVFTVYILLSIVTVVILIFMIIPLNKLEGEMQQKTDEIRKIDLQNAELEERLLINDKLIKIGEAASGVAHDFSNVLTIINGNIRLAEFYISENSPLKVQFEEIFTNIEGASNLGKNMIFSLLNIIREAKLEVEIIDINSILSNMEKLLRIMAKNNELQINLGAFDDNILGDQIMIEQLVMNLIKNAVDAFEDSKGTVKLFTTKTIIKDYKQAFLSKIPPGIYIVINVNDNASGIPDDVLANIFDPFYTTKKKGTGIGLSLIQNVVKSHKGFINVETVISKGTTFEIYLPIWSEK
ncbi:MAG: ATP-binding protein [Candidatus Heimdallarchaeota archaeon]|nr:ATP-binding protein [Candidatus Heimdallarchaeota archaeon]